MFVKSVIILSVIWCATAQDRKINSVLNPGLNNSDTDVTLVYVRADSNVDSVHQIWDFTQGIPTTIFAITKLNTSMKVTWDDRERKPSSFIWSEDPVYSFAVVIDKLYEYDDTMEAGEMTATSPRKAYDLKYIKWNRTQWVQTDHEALLEVQTKHYKADDGWRSGTINIKIDLVPFKDYALDLPHLIHSANSSLVDVKLVNMSLSPQYNSSRFALQVVIASTDSVSDVMHFMMRKSLDDEHTPGVFEIIEIKTPESYKKDDGGFIQFRPVAYTAEERGVTSSTNAHVSHFNNTHLPPGSTVKTYFRDFDRGLVQDMIVSFGEGGDGCYKQTNYTAWSFTVGYGLPPVEGFSLFVILVISIGLGIPVVLALSGITYVLVRKCRQTRNTPARLNNVD